jgi:hypothetical protein
LPVAIDNLDFSLAWKRLRLDRPDRVFFTPPHSLDWIESDLARWLETVNSQTQSGYAPKPSQTCLVPKPGWLVRPGSVLDLQDEIVFNALLATFHDRIYRQIGGFQGDPDIAYQLQSDSRLPRWIRTGFRVWREWREKSLHKLTQGSQFVVIADIAGFYENIDLNRLYTDLRPLAINSAALDLLMKCLNRWASPRGKGIPQGYTASDILAKLYVHPIDLGLRNDGITHLRYVDDIRIFCRTKLDAKQCLLKLNELIRGRGLNLQTAKTRILSADEAQREIDGISPLIQSIQSEMLAELKDVFSGLSSYVTLEEIEQRFASNPDTLAPEVLEQAFHDNFLVATAKFDKTLLHYLLVRLGKVKSLKAAPYVTALIAERPEETAQALRYLSDVEILPAHPEAIVEYMASEEAIYDYQLYQCISWFIERRASPPKLVSLCRRWGFDHNRAQWLRMSALAILGEAGDQSDLEMIEGRYEHATAEMERAAIVAALGRMETSRRNSFYGRVQSDGDMVARAIQWVRSH